jgi:hypothetical protein
VPDDAPPPTPPPPPPPKREEDVVVKVSKADVAATKAAGKRKPVNPAKRVDGKVKPKSTPR